MDSGLVLGPDVVPQAVDGIQHGDELPDEDGLVASPIQGPLYPNPSEGLAI